MLKFENFEFKVPTGPRYFAGRLYRSTGSADFKEKAGATHQTKGRLQTYPTSFNPQVDLRAGATHPAFGCAQRAMSHPAFGGAQRAMNVVVKV